MAEVGMIGAGPAGLAAAQGVRGLRALVAGDVPLC
jgi:NADPH-dependent glutamate synthase beta subunit-like oxidoreductase